jgi:hypothetical protein
MEIKQIKLEPGHRLEGHPNEVKATITLSLGLPLNDYARASLSQDCGVQNEAIIEFHVPGWTSLTEATNNVREIVGCLLNSTVAASFDQAPVEVY